jgi:NADPH2:quinone reductase
MRAAVVRQFGGPEAVSVERMPIPTPGPGEVLVRVHAASLNRLDVFERAGSHGTRPDLPHIPGRDVAGEVVAVGPLPDHDWSWLTPGSPVVGIGKGAHAEYAITWADLTLPWPPTLRAEEAAAIPTAGRSAYDALMRCAQVRAGEDVLVIAGGSGVGTFAIQIARACGCSVVTTVGSPAARDRALALGATAVLLHYNDDIVDGVKRLTDGHGVHVVLDHVGAPVWNAAIRALRPFGRFVTTGVTAGPRVELHLGRMFTSGITVAGVGRPPRHVVRGALEGVLNHAARGAIRPVLAGSWELADVEEAHRFLEAGGHFGKCVLSIAS